MNGIIIFIYRKLTGSKMKFPAYSYLVNKQ